ncbi:L-threonylcarbamoyladenylate synthase [Alteromonas facilis]|uniref:L-threonylcarbamoyladenylate synthase n=1 Tax=Alteromonas facilis TaxID=2048004 RepID=UPI000C28CA5F|nr:L-threonylcarbamoyladenylate synthase [Alteromonas facilis]
MSKLNTVFLHNDHEGITAAAQLLQQGGTVAVPTETVYGLAANATDDAAVKKIFTAKGRPSNHPLIVHIHTLEQLTELCIDIPPVAIELAKAFWPGPMTLILKKSYALGNVVTGGLDTIGIRMPAHPVFRTILAEGNLVVAAPSANPHKQLSPTTATQVFNELNGKIDAVVDGGACHVGLESTIVDVAHYPDSPIKVLRAGPITAQQMRDAINLPVESYRSHQQQVPGNIKQHYQPKGRLQVQSTQTIINALKQWPQDTACLWYSDKVGQQLKSAAVHGFVQIESDKASYARHLYSSLYALDNKGYANIWVEQPPQNENWDDVNDRLARAQA